MVRDPAHKAKVPEPIRTVDLKQETILIKLVSGREILPAAGHARRQLEKSKHNRTVTRVESAETWQRAN